MDIRGIILTLVLCISAASAHAVPPNVQTPEHFTPDSVRAASRSSSERVQRIYDSLALKSTRRMVPRLLYGMLFVKPRLDTTSSGRVLDEGRLLSPYEGKTIGEICIERQQVFSEGGNWLERTGNKTHMQTRERVIRRDLFIRSGDTLDPQLVVRNEQLLRSRAYIADADIQVLPDSLDTTRVNLIVRTRDSWTITIDGSLGSGGRTMVGLYDANIFGTGNKLKIKTNFDHRDFTYAGNMVEYEIPNILGTFYTANVSAGRDFSDTDLSIGLRKEFIRPTDYEAGVAYSDIKSRRYLLDRDTSLQVKVRNIDVWGGRSYYLRSIASSIFLTGHYSNVRHSIRPKVGPLLNPVFHDQDALLMGLGLYRERFFSANMVYGFGTKEYLATGYKAEIMSGYSWGEFNNWMYLGLGYKTGGFCAAGYFMGGFTLGSYIDLDTGAWNHSAVDIDVQWFSNLFAFRRNRIRQFLAIKYTQGWNRGLGANESIRFSSETGLQALDQYTVGSNRTVLNTETVIFTPYQPLGFRIALFGFADFGLIGYAANTFRNDFFCSFGAGVRIKNERLIFSTIQLRLGVALGKHGLVGSDYFRISNSTRIEQVRYRPSRPQIVGFQ